MPNGFGLGLNSSDCTEDCNGSVQDTQGAFYLGRKVHMPGSVDYIYLKVFPISGSGGTLDSNTPVLFLCHPVHGCLTVIYFANLMNFSRIKQNTLGRGGFSRIYVSHYSYVPHLIKHFHILQNLI